MNFYSNKKILKELFFSEYGDIKGKLTEDWLEHFREMYLKSELFKEEENRKRNKDDNYESVQDFIKRMTK